MILLEAAHIMTWPDVAFMAVWCVFGFLMWVFR